MPTDSSSLRGQVALVTGGGRGLGRAFAIALAEAGAAVAVTSRTEPEIQDTAQMIAQTGGKAIALSTDVTSPTDVANLISSVEQQLGLIDLLVNNAGVFLAAGDAVIIEQDAWWREVEINLRGPFLCTRAVLPGMIARRRGRIINLASGAGLGPIPGFTAYCTSKAALIRFSEIVALEAQAQGIAIFAIDPGTVRTPMNDHFIADALIGQRAPGAQAWMRQLFADGNDAPIERSVNLVLRLASGEADALSGCMISIDDNLDEMVRRAGDIKRDGLYVLRRRGLP